MILSLIIPTKNEEKRLRTFLPSVLAQDFSDFEMIIVDDPQTNDGTKAYIESLAQLYTNIHIQYLQHAPGLKPSAKRNLGASIAKGVYLYHLDADMYIGKTDFVSSIVFELSTSNTDALIIPERCDDNSWIARVKGFEKELIKDSISLQQIRIWKKEVFEKLGGFPEDILVGAQQILSDQTTDQGYNVNISQQWLYHYEYSNSLQQHLKKKWKYGSCLMDFAHRVTGLQKSGTTKNHLFFDRFHYIFQKLFWQNLGLGCQVLILKVLEFIAIFGGFLYYGVIKRKKLNSFR